MNTLDPLIGKTIDQRYLITARLARGGMASVYRATDQRLGREVAMKIIHPHLAEQQDFTNRFIQEARSAAALSNAHIVNVHDQGIAHTPDGNRAYLVMELISGPNLRRALSEKGSFTLGFTLEIAHQILLALAAAHKNGYIHRDVKPENILLSAPLTDSDFPINQSITAKVADFGLASAAASSTGMQTSSVLGTVAYIAPEIVSRSKVTPAADIYAVGIMIYELLSGKLPYTGESPLAIAYAHVNYPVPRLSDDISWMPPAIDSLIAVFTAKNPQKRPQNGSAALDVLEDIKNSIPEELLIRRIPVFPKTQTDLTCGTQRLNLQTEINITETNISNESIENTTYSDNTSVFPASDDASSPDSVAEDFATDITANETQIFSTKEQIKNPKNKKRRIIGLITAVFLTLLLTSTGYWYFTAGPGMRVTIPSVETLSQKDAQEKLTKAGLKFQIKHDFSDTIAKDKAIGTEPKAGARIHPADTLKLIISDGIEYRDVPDVSGKSVTEATTTLKNQTFNVETSEEWSDDIPKDNVIRQDPAPATSLPHDSTVKIVISKGRQPVTVPKITGLQIEKATELLSRIGLKIEVTEEFSDTIEKNTVMTQDIAEGETRYRNDTIKLSVSKGPELIKVPNVVGQQQESAKQVLEKSGFKVQIERILGGFFGTVRLQSPGAGEMARSGSVVKLSVV